MEKWSQGRSTNQIHTVMSKNINSKQKSLMLVANIHKLTLKYSVEEVHILGKCEKLCYEVTENH